MTSGQTSDPPVGTLGATSIDCPNPGELADFYAALLGMRRLVETPDGGVVAITDGAAILALMRVDDYRAPTWPNPDVPTQVHLDVSVTDVDTAVAAAERLGARQADVQPQPTLWRVMLDPVGHPFCLTTVTAG
ncbi:MAG: VOC family protein [Mycobacterium kyogaense]|uniref:VOC family protein n=1 Tax=Mycobacterium kyogaense TaxID=2212479 RepID=UPI002FF959AE